MYLYVQFYICGIYIQSSISVDAVGKFQAVKQSNQNLIHDRGKYWSFLQASIPFLGPTQPPTQWVPGALAIGVRWTGSEAYSLPASRAEVKSE